MWAESEREQVIKTLAVVCEVTGTDLSQPAKALIVASLGQYPAPQVLGALTRCASECRFKVTLADIVSRLDDGRPGAEEAWALMPKAEEDAGVVTDEMSAAWWPASKLYDEDPIAARMAFRETYEREVREHRQHAIPMRRHFSPGLNKALTESVAIEAVKAGKLTLAQIAEYVLPEHRPVEMKALPAASEVQVAFEPTQLAANKKRLAELLKSLDGKTSARTTTDAAKVEP